MKVLILAGGFGTRLSEETGLRPKPLVEIGEEPMLWHIMNIYAAHGFNEFVVLLGYKGYLIKEYFHNYFLHRSDFTIDMKENKIEYLKKQQENWKVTLLDTGIDTLTGGRVKRAQDIVGNEPFLLTYGDGVSDIDISALVKFHKSHGKLMTMTSVIPEGRFGRIKIEKDNSISEFIEKPKEENWINGGFFVCQPEVFNYLEDDRTILERAPLEKLAADKELAAFKHRGFWKCMDTLLDKNDLNKMWEGKPKWKIWK